MAQKYLKIIQDGVTSYVPDTEFVRNFWAKQNSRLGKTRNAQYEMVTLMPATDEEVEFMTKPVANVTLTDTIKPFLPADNRLDKLQAQLESQQALINTLMGKLLEAQTPTPPTAVQPVEAKQVVAESGSIETQPDTKVTETRSKPGPKPKTSNDGKDETEVDAQA